MTRKCVKLCLIKWLYKAKTTKYKYIQRILKMFVKQPRLVAATAITADILATRTH